MPCSPGSRTGPTRCMLARWRKVSVRVSRPSAMHYKSSSRVIFDRRTRREMMSGQTIQVTAYDGGKFAAYLAKPAQGSGPGLVLLQEIFCINGYMKSMAA